MADIANAMKYQLALVTLLEMISVIHKPLTEDEREAVDTTKRLVGLFEISINEQIDDEEMEVQ